MHILKKLLAFLLCLVMLVGLFPLSALAEGEEEKLEAEQQSEETLENPETQPEGGDQETQEAQPEDAYGPDGQEVETEEIEIVCDGEDGVDSFSTGYPNTWTNTGDQARDIAEIAYTQIGYSGTSKSTKYSYWYNGYEVSENWCAVFVCWCANQAGIPLSIIPKSKKAGIESFGLTRGSNCLRFSESSPRKGDLAFIENDGSNSYWGEDHIGIIYDVDDQYVYTVEGNTSDAVHYYKYYRSNGVKVGNSSVSLYWVGRPNYSGTPVPSAPTVSASYDLYCVGSNIRISWSDVSYNQYYWLHIYKDGDTIVNQNMGTQTSYTLENAARGSYTVYVTANNSAGGSGSGSCSFSVRNIYTTTWTSESSSINGTHKSTFTAGYWVYLWYKIYDKDTGELLDNCGSLNYSVKETIYDSDGKEVTSYSYTNDNNWIRCKLTAPGTYTGKVVVSGDQSCTVNTSFTIVRPASPTVTTDKAVYVLGETVTISFANAKDLQYYAYLIKKDGSEVASNLELKSSSDTYVPQETGTYEIQGTYVNQGNGIAEPVTISFRVVSASYKVQYNANGGTGAPSAQTKYHGINLTLSTTKPTRAASTTSCTVTLNANGGTVGTTKLTAEKKTSYTFKNWNTSQNGQGVSFAPGETYPYDIDVTLYAQWNSSTTTSAVTLPMPTRTGYGFQNWNTKSDGSGTAYNAGASYTPSGNVTLYAIWKANTYTVSYNANGGTGAPASQTKTHDVTLTLSSTKPTRSNASAGSYTVTLNANGGSVSSNSLAAARTTKYSFKNWNTKSDGSGTSYASGGSYTANAAVTLYAQWNSSTTTSAVTLPTPTRTGYSFKGWATSASATSGTTGSYTPTGNVTLYAIWKQDQTTAGTLSLGTARGQAGSEVVLEVMLDKNPGVMAISLKLEYDKSKLQYLGGEDGTLTGWTFSADGDGALWDSDRDKTATGSIAKLRFKILNNAQEGEVSVNVKELEAWNYEEQQIHFGASAGKVTISNRLPGDVTGDGKVNGQDLIRLRKYLAGDSVTIELSNADVTGDGKVNGQDLIRLRKYLAGDNVVLL